MLDIFSKAEPGQLPHVVSSSFMMKASPACVLAHLEQLEVCGAPSVTLTLCKAVQALRLRDLELYQQQMDCHAEVRGAVVCSFIGLGVQRCIKCRNLIERLYTFKLVPGR